MTREERRLMAAIAKKSPVVTPVCRHGFPVPTHEVSRSFRDENGEKRWYRAIEVTENAGCPDD